MSYKSWAETYYPEPASCLAAWNPRRWMLVRATEHSLRKWQGLRPGPLAEHGLKVITQAAGAAALWDSKQGRAPHLYLTGSTCALCAAVVDECQHCPLAQARSSDGNNAVPCDVERDDESVSPYHQFVMTGDPEPMIQWLKKTLENLKKTEN